MLGPNQQLFALPGKPVRATHSRTILLSLARQAASPEACGETEGSAAHFSPGAREQSPHRVLRVQKLQATGVGD